MSSEEWIGLVHWLETQGVRWTVDIAAKYGVKLKAYDAGKVRQAMSQLLAHRMDITAERVITQLCQKPSKYQSVIEKAHRRIYPNGCRSAWCDVCGVVDIPSEVRHNA